MEPSKIPSPSSSSFPGQPQPGSHLNEYKGSELLGALSHAKANSVSSYQEWRRALESQQELSWHPQVGNSDGVYEQYPRE